jgi:predicted lactoylglutathione lyase
MTTKIFVNLAVQDLDRSKAFFKELGFTFNPQIHGRDGRMHGDYG